MNMATNSTPAPRTPLKLDIEYRRSYARRPIKGTLKNLSLTGAFLETSQVPEIRSEDRLVFTFEVSGRLRKVQAHVVWKNGRGCGVRFQPNSQRDVQIVDDLLEFIEASKESHRSVLDHIFKRVA